MKKAIFIMVIVVSALVINGLVRSIYDTWNKRELVESAQKQLETEKRENESLKTQLQNAQDGNFIEEQARNKLLLVKPGDQTVLVPDNIATKFSSEKKLDLRPNWQKWWDLFF